MRPVLRRVAAGQGAMAITNALIPPSTNAWSAFWECRAKVPRWSAERNAYERGGLRPRFRAFSSSAQNDLCTDSGAPIVGRKYQQLPAAVGGTSIGTRLASLMQTLTFMTHWLPPVIRLRDRRRIRRQRCPSGSTFCRHAKRASQNSFHLGRSAYSSHPR
jgi:hypothetical protein